jgi:hypothetical protein
MDIEIISDEFRLQQANRYSLWLHLSDDHCSFAILDDASRSFVGIKRVNHISLTKTIELFDELSAISFSRVFIALDSQPSVLVPNVLFRQDNKRDFLNFAAEYNEEHDVFEQYIPSLSVVNVFAVAPSFKTFVTPYFSQAVFIPMSSALLIAVSGLSRTATGVLMGIRLMESGLLVCLFERGKLLFYNHFLIKTEEDVLYWLSRLCDQFHLDASKIGVYMQDVQNLMDEKIAFLKRYFTKLNLFPLPQEYQIAPELKEKPIELFTDLFYLPLCEL